MMNAFFLGCPDGIPHPFPLPSHLYPALIPLLLLPSPLPLPYLPSLLPPHPFTHASPHPFPPLNP